MIGKNKKAKDADAEMAEELAPLQSEPSSPEADPSGDVIQNIGHRVHSINGITLEPGEKYTLKQGDIDNENLMAKIATGIRCGVLSRASN